MILKKNNFFFLFFLIFLIGFFFRYYNNFYEGYWSDEILTLIISNPSLSRAEMIQQWWKHDGSPIIYFFLLKYFFNFFGFTAENGRIFSLIFSILTILLSIKFFNIRYKNELLLSAIFLLAINIFLIWQAKETRIPSSVSFFSMLNVVFFYYLLKKRNKFNFFLLFLFNLLLICYYPFTFTIVISQFIYLCFLTRKIKKILIYLFYYSLIILLYIYINFDYLTLHGSRGLGHIGTINYKFFFNYFFSTYFGTYFFGGLCLIIFFLAFIKNLIKKTHIGDIIYFHILIIIFTYIFLILYTLFKTEIAVSRYFIFLIPSIIFITTDFFKIKKIIFLRLFLLIAFANTIYSLQKGLIPKPPMKELISVLSLKESNIILHNENWFEIYFNNYIKISQKYKIIDKSQANKYDKIWFVCFNNIRADRGYLKLNDEEKCNMNLDKFIKQKVIYIPDFKIILFSKS